MCVFGFVFSFCRPSIQASLPHFHYIDSLLRNAQRTTNLLLFLIKKAYGFPNQLCLLFAYFCCFRVYRKRIHSAPLLHCPSLVTPSVHHQNPSVKASTDKTKVTSVLNNLTIIKTTTDLDVLNVSSHDFRGDESRHIDTNAGPSFYGDQKRRRQSERRGRLHRVASKLLARAMTTDAPALLHRRRHSTPTRIVEETNNVVQEAEREQNDRQTRKPRPSRRKSLLSRARSLRGVKSLSDLKTIARRRELKGQCGSSPVERQDQAGATIECALVTMRSVNSATVGPLCLFRAAE